jgi:hypothetical protein
VDDMAYILYSQIFMFLFDQYFSFFNVKELERREKNAAMFIVSMPSPLSHHLPPRPVEQPIPIIDLV